ncbi:collagen alpha-1(XII) chain-like [Conger conger]|uniref:collagen alpha-1(XII) chain-like n=1 Tax=Conger conger TaxID=82655 RepID=UPI002A5AE943|nr:collagen alpha-1(XII) chain-like [Conger conger]
MKIRLSLAAVALLAVLVTWVDAQEECSLGVDVQADVVLLVDGSYSIGLANFAKVRAFLEVLVKTFDIGRDKVQISLVQYSRDPHTEFALNTHNDLDAVVKAVRTFPYRGGSTNTGRAMTYVREKIFVSARGARTNVPRVTILITDGKSSDAFKDPATRLRSTDVEIFAVGVKDAVRSELEAIASEPKETHVYTVEDFDAFQRISKELTQSICLRIEQELLNIKKRSLIAPRSLTFSEVTSRSFRASWLSNSTNVLSYLVQFKNAEDPNGDYVSISVPGDTLTAVLPHLTPLTRYEVNVFAHYLLGESYSLTGEETTLEEIKCNTSAKADIILLVDGSWSIGFMNFRTIRTFIGRMVGVFNIGPNLVQIGLAQYSDDPKTEWHLNAYKTRKELLDAVANLPYKGGNTMTGLALNNILQNNFKPNVGLRPDSKKIGVLITDGKSQDEIIINSENLRKEGIELYAVGVKNADENELRSIASDPDDIHMYNVEDFSDLLDIVDRLTDNLCNSFKGSDGPEPPTNLETSEMTHRSFRATWTAPAGSVEKYRLEYMIAARGPTHEMSVNGTVTTVVLNNLNPLTEYIVKVFAVSEDVSSEPLKGTEITLPVPSARNLRVSDETTTTMKVSWDAAAGATGYQLLYRAVNATVPSEEKEVRVGGGVTEVHLEHLFPNTLYSLSLIALHGEEASDPTVINQSWTKLMPGFNTG